MKDNINAETGKTRSLVDCGPCRKGRSKLGVRRSSDRSVKEQTRCQGKSLASVPRGQFMVHNSTSKAEQPQHTVAGLRDGPVTVGAMPRQVKDDALGGGHHGMPVAPRRVEISALGGAGAFTSSQHDQEVAGAEAAN